MMIDIRKYQVHDLLEWLEIATKELVAPVKERFLLEINAHYTEAFASHLVDGLSESDARREALAELGDPDEAAKRFRKQHLTVREAGMVEGFFRMVGSRRYLLCSYLYYFLCACWCFYHFKLDQRSFMVYLAAGFFAAIIVPTASFFMVRCKTKYIGLLLLMQAVDLSFFPFSLSYCVYGFSSEFGYNFFFNCFFIIVWWIIYSPSNNLFRPWHKLSQVSNVWDEISLRNE
jgi:hypothetical protein